MRIWLGFYYIASIVASLIYIFGRTKILLWLSILIDFSLSSSLIDVDAMDAGSMSQSILTGFRHLRLRLCNCGWPQRTRCFVGDHHLMATINCNYRFFFLGVCLKLIGNISWIWTSEDLFKNFKHQRKDSSHSKPF